MVSLKFQHFCVLSVLVPASGRLAKFLNLDLVDVKSVDYFYEIVRRFKKQYLEDKSADMTSVR